METNTKLIIGVVIMVLAVFSGVTIYWQFEKDWIKLYSDGDLIAKEKWVVNAERTYIVKDSWYDRNVKCPKIIDMGGHETATRCYYPDQYYESLSRSLIRTGISAQETSDQYLVTKKSPNYMYGTRGSYAGYVIESMFFNKKTERVEEFPENYLVNWAPRDTRNYKLEWRIESLDEINLPDGLYHDCEYVFGNIKIDLKNHCSDLEYAEIKDQSKIYFIFNNKRGEQDFDLSLTDPVWLLHSADPYLVSRWSCEGNFDDSVGSNHGSQSGGVSINRGVRGRACEFDGSNDFINATDLTVMNSSQNWSVSSWAYSLSGSGAIWGKDTDDGCGGASNDLWNLIDFTSNNLRVLIGCQAEGSAYSHTTSGTDYTNQWVHITITHLSNGSIEFYINGISEDSGVDTNNWTTTTCFTIGGRRCTGTYSPFNGTIDEVRIYNTSLTASEISSLYNSTKSYHFNIKTTPTEGLVDESGLVGHWTMNAKDGSNSATAKDVSGQGNDGTVTSATFTNEGRFKEGYKFDGSGDYVTTGINISEFSFQRTDNFSISIWFKPNTTNINYAGIIQHQDPLNFDGWNMYIITNNQIGFVLASSGTDKYSAVTGSNTINVNEWNHAVLTYNGSSDVSGFNLYVDGVLKSLSPTDNDCGASIIYSTATAMIGRRDYSDIDFAGSIDEVRIYNRSLSSTEVANLYNGTKSNHFTIKTDPSLGLNNETGLVGLWHFDSKDGSNSTTAIDSSGQGNNGTVSGATFTNEGRFKEGYSFDGDDDRIDITGTNPPLTGNFTVSAWVYPLQADNAWHSIIGRDSYIDNVWIALKENTNDFSVYLEDVIQTSTTGGNLWTNNQWNHIAITYNGSLVQTYVDGIFKENLPGTYSGVIGSSNVGLNIGDVGAYDMNGSIDEVRIYNRALTPTEIAGLYSGTKSRHLNILEVIG